MLGPIFMEIARWIAAALQRIWSRRRGSVAVQTGILLTVLIGTAGLATEITYLLYKHKEIQSAAGSAAISASVAIGQDAPRDPLSEARSVAASLGFVDDGGVTTSVTVNNPPLSGPYAGITRAVEVIISQPQPVSAFQLFGAGTTVAVSVRAVARKSDPDWCILTLSTSGVGVNASGGAVVTLSGCGMYINSSGAGALTENNASTVTASAVWIVGEYDLNGGSTVTTDEGAPHTGAPAIADPYAAQAVPAPGACTRTNYVLNGGSATLSPGTYCGGIEVTGGGALTLNSGVYILTNNGTRTSHFYVRNNSTVTGTGVTIVLTGPKAGNIGVVTIDAGSTITVSAPAAGATAGLAFFQDPKVGTGGTNSFQGGPTQNIKGAVYFPRQRINFTGGSGAADACTQIISRLLYFTGVSNLRLNCTGIPIKPIEGGGSPQLVE
jgi:hypothetical protein